MMDRTDRHFRRILRSLTRRSLLYTEMLTTGAVLRGDRERLLGYDEIERPLALQLGGDDPRALAECARVAEGLGYDEVNLNVGCPSDRVRRGNFGACLMTDPALVARCVERMRSAVRLPVTVKHRIGVDDRDGYDDMRAFVATVAAAGCDRFIVHARKAWLSGLSPKQNREVPPLRHADVHRLKREQRHLRVEINGGFTDLESAHDQLARVDGVMIGRAAYDRPFMFARADRMFFGETTPCPTRREVVLSLLPYVERLVAEGVPLTRFSRHALNLFAGKPGARAWRRSVGESSRADGAGVEVLLSALDRVPAAVLDARPRGPEIRTRRGSAADPTPA